MSDFASFAQAHGLRLRPEDPIPDGRWHRVRTESKPRKFNGAYLWDGVRGVVRDWATMEGYAAYRPDGTFERVPPRDYRELRRKAAAEEARKHAKAAAEAARIVKAATLITPCAGRPWRPGRPAQEAVVAHPYLIKKSLPGEACLVHDGFLIVPMRIERQHRRELVNVQRINADGEKRFLAGGRAKGAVHHIGPANAREVWLVEGFATGFEFARGAARHVPQRLRGRVLLRGESQVRRRHACDGR
jgi:putative DNA primase/helicase